MTEIELLIDIHKNNQRQGPGSKQETKKALALMRFSKNDKLNIADIGCGSGDQTITLAQNTNSNIQQLICFLNFLKN